MFSFPRATVGLLSSGWPVVPLATRLLLPVRPPAPSPHPLLAKPPRARVTHCSPPKQGIFSCRVYFSVCEEVALVSTPALRSSWEDATVLRLESCPETWAQARGRPPLHTCLPPLRADFWARPGAPAAPPRGALPWTSGLAALGGLIMGPPVTPRDAEPSLDPRMGPGQPGSPDLLWRLKGPRDARGERRPHPSHSQPLMDWWCL